MKLKEAFKIRKKDAESDEVIITIGNHLASEQVFRSEEEAQNLIVTGKQIGRASCRERVLRLV